MTNSALRIVAALFLRLYVHKDQDADDPRTKTMTFGEDNVMSKIKMEAFPGSCSLKYARHYCREEEKEKERKVLKSVLGRNCLYRILLCTFIMPMTFSKNELWSKTKEVRQRRRDAAGKREREWKKTKETQVSRVRVIVKIRSEERSSKYIWKKLSAR